MMRILSVWVVISFIFFNTGIRTFAFEWTYKHQEYWPEKCLRGTHQSPIALSRESATERTFPSFHFIGYDALYPALITNNGHTVEIRLNIVSKPRIIGGGLSSAYVLDSMHFHWNSEHTISGRRFPLELHMVHYSEKYGDLARALQYEDGVAVLGVLFYISPDDDTELQPIYSAIHNLIQRKVKTNIRLQLPDQVELDDFLPRDRAGFYRYHGSLTTPPCTEKVIWTIFTEGLPISKNQLHIFTTLRTDTNETLVFNYRPLQEVNGRVVEMKMSDVESSGATRFGRSSSLVLIFLTILRAI